jgi:rubrerythrin
MADDNRDDLPERTKRILQERVGNRYSNPDCRCLTSGPNLDDNKATRVGTAAHITAASSGGPRFDPTLTAEQRKAIENGIWLCRNCGTLVDGDHYNYPVDLSLEWKRRAEELARLELEGKPIPPDFESKGYVCTYCGTFVKKGNTVCLGCQAEVAYGSTEQEWVHDF